MDVIMLKYNNNHPAITQFMRDLSQDGYKLKCVTGLDDAKYKYWVSFVKESK